LLVLSTGLTFLWLIKLLLLSVDIDVKFTYWYYLPAGRIGESEDNSEQCLERFRYGVSLAHANLRDKGPPCLRDPDRLSAKAMAHPLEPFQYEDLPTQTSFRVIELLPGQGDSPVSCLLHIMDWSNPLEYEAISYAWGDPSARAPVTCHGKRVEVTQNLHWGLTHFRLQDRSRFLWVDSIW
jgi:Heterokaryon incompatibility protein (HET)